jgi:cytoskeletal protein RodZ
MHNLSDEELDRLSKEAADRYSAPPVQSTWEKLSRRLDDEMPQDKKDRKIIFWLSLLLLLIGGGALYYFTQGKDSANNQQATEIVSSTTAAKEKKIAPVDDGTNKATSKSTDVAVEKNSEKNSESVSTITRANDNVADNKPVPKQVQPGVTRSSNKIQLAVVAKNKTKPAEKNKIAT